MVERAEQSVLLTETVAEVLARQARVNGDKRAVIWEQQPGELVWLTYAQLAARANAVAHTLSGLAAGERVAVWGRNCVDWVLVEYACALRGLVLMALNTAWTDAEVTAALELGRAGGAVRRRRQPRRTGGGARPAARPRRGGP